MRLTTHNFSGKEKSWLAESLAGSSSENLELAYLYFLEQFRKVYIGEHAKQVRL